MRLCIMKCILILALLVAGNSTYGYDLSEQIMEIFEHCGSSPVIQIDQKGYLHILLCALNPNQNAYSSYEELRYYKYVVKGNKKVYSYTDDERPSISLLKDLNITENGNVYFMYSHVNEYFMNVLHLFIIIDGQTRKISINEFPSRWNAVLPGDRFLLLNGRPFDKTFTIYNKDGSITKIGDHNRFYKQWAKLQYAPCYHNNETLPQMKYLSNNMLLAASYCTDPKTDPHRMKECQKKLQLFKYDISADSMTIFRVFDLFSDPDVIQTDLGFNRINIYTTNDDLIHIVAGRAYPNEPGKLSYITIDENLNPIKSESFQTMRGTEQYSLTDTGIDHQIFWLEPSQDSNYVGSIMRYVFVSDTLYYSESEPIYARARVAIREREECRRKQELGRPEE